MVIPVRQRAMSSATDPDQPLGEGLAPATRACPGRVRALPARRLLNVQTRSPLVQEEIHRGSIALGDRCWLNFTLETDLESVRKAATPRCPPIGARGGAPGGPRGRAERDRPTVSPCLPYSDVETFGTLLLALGSGSSSTASPAATARGAGAPPRRPSPRSTTCEGGATGAPRTRPARCTPGSGRALATARAGRRPVSPRCRCASRGRRGAAPPAERPRGCGRRGGRAPG